LFEWSESAPKNIHDWHFFLGGDRENSFLAQFYFFDQHH
ncbi:MAG: hypothetical protein ACI90V_009903, partial [Bacillariaceae sp.]